MKFILLLKIGQGTDTRRHSSSWSPMSKRTFLTLSVSLTEPDSVVSFLSTVASPFGSSKTFGFAFTCRLVNSKPQKMIWKYLHIKTTKLKRLLQVSGTHSHFFSPCLWGTTNAKEIWQGLTGQYGVHIHIKGQGFPFCYMCFKSITASNGTTRWQQILVFCYHVLSMND